MADPLYPDVPNTPGVPPVRREGELDDAVTEQNASLADQSLAPPEWGIFDEGGSRVVEPDSFSAFEVSSDFRIADYPMEKGAFESYDKVAMPFDTRVAMTKGGTLADRTKFLESVQKIAGTLDLYSVVTPEKTYINVNVAAITMSRTADRGATLLTVEIALREIRQTAVTAYTKTATTPAPAPAPTPPQQGRRPTTNPGTTKKPSGARRISGGSVQPTRIKPMSRKEEAEISAAGRKRGLNVQFGDAPPPNGVPDFFGYY